MGIILLAISLGYFYLLFWVSQKLPHASFFAPLLGFCFFSVAVSLFTFFKNERKKEETVSFYFPFSFKFMSVLCFLGGIFLVGEGRSFFPLSQENREASFLFSLPFLGVILSSLLFLIPSSKSFFKFKMNGYEILWLSLPLSGMILLSLVSFSHYFGLILFLFFVILVLGSVWYWKILE